MVTFAICKDRSAASRRDGSRSARPFIRARWLVIFAALVLMLLSGALAQSQEGNSTTQSEDPLPSILGNGMLKMDYRLEVLGPDGKPVLTNITLEELRKLRSSANLSSQLPAANFTSVTVDAVVAGDQADVTGRFEVQLGSSPNPARIDLRFDTCLLTEPPKLSGDQGRVRFVEGGGYEWLLLGEENSTHSVTLAGKSLVQQQSDRYTLTMNLPAALTKISVRLPAKAVEIRAQDVWTATTTDDSVNVEVNSRGGDFSISWRERGSVERMSAIEADSATTFEIIEPQQTWSATTDLRVKWYGNDAEKQFEIQLPPGAMWRTYPNAAEFEPFRITMVDATPTVPGQESDATSTSPQKAVVQMLDAQSESLELSLEWDWMPPDRPDDVDVPLPVVTGVDLHQGTIDCIFPASYAAVFREGPGAKLVQQGRLTTGFRQQQMQFRFDRQDFELSMSFREEQSLPTVRPTYKVNVDQNKLVLTAWFDCSFDTSSPQQIIGLIPGDWILEENTARVLRDPSDPYSVDSEVLSVRRQDDGSYILSGREPDGGFGTSRRIEQMWRVVAQRSWSPDEGNAIEFQIPEIIRGSSNGLTEVDHGSGVLLVASADDVLMQWSETASTGLLSDSFSTEYQGYVNDVRVREPLAYRFQSRGTTPNWAGKAEFLPQLISYEQHCDLEVFSSEIFVQQLLSLQIANEPLTDLRIAVREDAGPSPQVLVNGELTALQLVGTSSSNAATPLVSANVGTDTAAESTTARTAENGKQWRQYQIVGAPDLLGRAQVSVLTTVPFSLPGATATQNSDAVDAPPVVPTSQSEGDASSAAIDVPLAQFLLPESARVKRQEWRLSSDLKLDVSVKNPNAEWESLATDEKPRTLQVRSESLELQLRKRKTTVVSPVVINGSFLQSVITGDKRRDRFVARVQSSSGKLDIRLPRASDLEMVAVDGVEMRQADAPYDYNSKSLSITLPIAEGQGDHVVELFYFLDDTLAWISPISLETPQFEGADNQGRFYWQLLTPSDKHLGWSPNSLTAEWTWQWNALWWYRQSADDQTSLERLIGASQQARQPISANSYVMSGQGDVAPQTIWVLSRFVLWFPMGILAIALSVMALNFAFLRSPVTAIVLSGVIVALATIWPDMAVLLGQTAVLSLSLVALILVTQAAIDARVRRRSVFTARPSTYMEGSDHFSVARSVRLSNASTAHHGSSVVAAGEK